jgi:hypothetical protein
MPIKYAEITIIINTEKETIINYFNRLLLGNENETNDNDTIIILFDDGIIYDVKKEYNTNTKTNTNTNTNTKLLKMGPRSFKTNSPIYFEIKDKNETFFSKTPTVDYNGNLKLDSKPIFANNKKHTTTKKEPSAYNSIFKRGNNEVLAIVKIKSSEEKPRFLLAYDDEYFKKEHIIYFVNCIFSI